MNLLVEDISMTVPVDVLRKDVKNGEVVSSICLRYIETAVDTKILWVVILCTVRSRLSRYPYIAHVTPW